MKNKKESGPPQRRLSIFRVLLALIVLAGVAYYVNLNWRDWRVWESTENVRAAAPWFAPYVDVTATPQYDFEKLGTTSARNVMLAFIVASSAEPCTPSWGNAYTLERAGIQLDLDRRIARLRQLGGDVAVSFGGLLNAELAETCTDPNRLREAYLSVIERYQVATLDFDLELEALSNKESAVRRAKVLAELQQELRQNGKDLAIWVTLPVAPQGMTEEGTTAVSTLLENGVDLAGVNVMTMNYGESKQNYDSLYEASERALIETHRQLGILYKQAGFNLNSNSLWNKLGATPMIGQNDVVDEVFTLEDAKLLNNFIRSKGIVRMSMWSANRDLQCGDNYVNLSVVSDSCSGIKQDRLSFATELASGLEGNFALNAAAVTKDDPDALLPLEDDPENSPYPIWNEDNVYLEGNKVVWRRNVYVAKWWTQGEIPDNPILQYWQTPWELLGPVLPGEKPIALPTLPPGTYPEWSGKKQYESGDRVIFNGLPYQAKWWTQGDSPAAASANPAASPWVALSQKQVELLLDELGITDKQLTQSED